MKEISAAALDHLLKAHPGATVEDKDGARIVRVPMYDIGSDKAWIEERRVIDSKDTPMGILPVLNLRHGPNFNAGGEPKESPLGHLYRIIGYSPPPKKDDAD